MGLMILLSSCGFQQRKYTRGAYFSRTSSPELEASQELRPFGLTTTTAEEELHATAEDPLNSALYRSENWVEHTEVKTDEYLHEMKLDTLDPNAPIKREEEDFVAAPDPGMAYNGMSQERFALNSEVQSNLYIGIGSLVGWMIISLFAGGLGIWGVIKSRKTQQKIMMLNKNGQYADLLQTNKTALVLNAISAGLLALFALFFLFIAVLFMLDGYY